MKAAVIHAAKDLRIKSYTSATLNADQDRVAIKTGGICGSDLHYCHDGGFDAVRRRQPMIPGHQVSGVIAELGNAVEGLAIGDRVAVSPGLSCRNRPRPTFTHCMNMRSYGSPMSMPHIQGTFRAELIADVGQCHRISPRVRPDRGARRPHPRDKGANRYHHIPAIGGRTWHDWTANAH